MALFSLKPIYKSWLNKTSTLDLPKKIDDFIISTKNVNKNILDGILSDKDLDKEIKNLTTKHLYLNLIINNEKLNNQSKDWTNLDKKINIVNDNIKTLQNYEKNYLLKNQQKNINLLSMVNLIFLPLSFIVGYYGMNFVSMSSKNGPFNFKYGQSWVFFFNIDYITNVLFFKKQNYLKILYNNF